MFFHTSRVIYCSYCIIFMGCVVCMDFFFLSQILYHKLQNGGFSPVYASLYERVRGSLLIFNCAVFVLPY